jgi:hypothetical protein
MRQMFTALESIFASLHGLHKALFFVEVTRHNFLNILIGLAPLLGRSLREPGFEMGVEVYFHTPQDTEKSTRRQEYPMSDHWRGRQSY